MTVSRHVAVVGGGATGVELAGTAAELRGGGRPLADDLDLSADPAACHVALLAGLRGDHRVARPSFFQLDNIRKARRRVSPGT